MMTRTLAGLTGLLMAAQAVAGTPAPEERYAAAQKVLNAKCDQFCGYDLADAAEVKALDDLWDATEDWTAAFLTSHSLRDLTRTIEKRETDALNRRPNNTAAPDSVTPLAPDLYAFTAQWGEAGTVFLAQKQAGHWQVVWDIRKADTKAFPVLTSWRSEAARNNCREHASDDHYADCGPLFGAVTVLRPDAQGRPRFMLRATYAQFAGMTVGNQISFWRWNGHAAEPLIAKTYAFMIDDSSATETVTPDRATLWVKDEFKSFYACGGCIGRQVHWTFRVLSDRIIDEGQKPVVPEMDAVDALLDQRLAHKPAADLASTEAIASLDRILAPLGKDGLSMESDHTVKHTATGASVCLSTDALPATRFDLIRRGSGFFVTAVQPLNRENCTQPAEK